MLDPNPSAGRILGAAEEDIGEGGVVTVGRGSPGKMAVGSGVPKGVLDPAGAVLGGVAAAYKVAEAKDVTHDPS